MPTTLQAISPKPHSAAQFIAEWISFNFPARALSYDDVESELADVYDKSQWNPKLGVTWEPLPDTTIRAAAFRVLKRTLVTEQTLAPTQVAGFNQFYDEVNSTDSWTYGVALDQKLGATLFGGLELSRRDLTVPFEFLYPEFIPGTSDWREKNASAYAYWAPHPRFSVNAGYQYEKSERGYGGNHVADLKTQRLPLGVHEKVTISLFPSAIV